jgi:hypothetical protein
MATRGHLKIAKNHYFAFISSIKIYPPYGNTLMYLLDGGGAEKNAHFFSNISQTKTCVLGPNWKCFSLSEGRKCVVSRIYEVKG